MIVRILGQGQYAINEDTVAELNFLDDQLQAATDAGDETGFALTLGQMLATVRYRGARLAEDTIVPSDLVLPAVNTDLREVKAMLRDDGLIPG
ncbi:hypothetical protein AB0E01_39690 [Nocardia vinacea]|uniref:PspA-associated protein PspAA n=1 Tax=Nocardia vinacea TaxID=96468 RepID=UPI0033F7E992